MDYVVDLAIPANTAQADCVTEILRVPKGVITGLRVFFPPGCAGLAGVRVKCFEQQIYPSNPDSWYRGDGLHIVITDDHRLTHAFQTVKFQGYNLDDSYPHTVTVSLTVLSASEALAGAGLPAWFQRLLRLGS